MHWRLLSEVFFRMGDNRYAVTGVLLSEGEILSIWKLDLVRPTVEGADEDTDSDNKPGEE